MLPSVIFVGPTKCGTTWIDTYLRTRPELALPVSCKETFFFDKVFERGTDWYAAQFGDQTGMGVEVAPSLFHKPQAVENLARTLPHAKIVVVFRDPYDRAVSHYFHYRKAGVPRMTIAQMADRHPDVVEAGLFDKHARAWEAAFPGQVHYMSYDTLKADPRGFCSQLCAILGLPDTMPPSEALMGRSVNSASIPRNLFVARLTRRGAELARKFGAHGLVNALRKSPLKKAALSGGGDVGAERSEVRKDVAALSDRLGADLAAFEARLAARLTGE